MQVMKSMFALMALAISAAAAQDAASDATTPQPVGVNLTDAAVTNATALPVANATDVAAANVTVLPAANATVAALVPAATEEAVVNATTALPVNATEVANATTAPPVTALPVTTLPPPATPAPVPAPTTPASAATTVTGSTSGNARVSLGTKQQVPVGPKYVEDLMIAMSNRANYAPTVGRPVCIAEVKKVSLLFAGDGLNYEFQVNGCSGTFGDQLGVCKEDGCKVPALWQIDVFVQPTTNTYRVNRVLFLS